VSLREFLYPLMQGYDSVAVRADVELGGFDQLFNLKAGRTIQKHYGQKEQNVLTLQMLEGTDGRKMSTSWGNIITIVDEPFDMYGKIMSLRDDLLIKYFILTTDMPMKEISAIEKQLKKGVNPRDIKMKLAKTLVTMYHNETEAAYAEESFIETFQKGGVPEDVLTIAIEGETLPEALIKNKLVESKTEWKRLIESGSIKTEDGTKIEDPNFYPTETCVLKIGKKRFVKITI